MAIDNGVAAQLEKYIVDTLKALEVDSEKLFKTVDHFAAQLSDGGNEAFEALAPFAFVTWQPPSGEREGDYSLRTVYRIVVVIAQHNRKPGVARIGDGKNLGLSAIHEHVIAAIDRKHPGDGLACDDLYYKGSYTILMDKTKNAIQMAFEANCIVS